VILATEPVRGLADRSFMRTLTSLLVGLVCSGCVQTVALQGDVHPANPLQNPSVEAVGVVCSESLLSNTTTGQKGVSLYKVQVGQSLCSALLDATRGAYRSAQTSLEPYKGQFARVIKYDLARSSLDFETQADGSQKVVAGLEVVVERYNRDLRFQSRNVLVGNALVDAENGGTREEQIQQATQAALQEVTDKTASFLIAGLGDEPRQHGKKSAKKDKKTDPSAPASPAKK
jgi:hypothetical protein